MSRRYSVFNLSHEHKMTGNMGVLYPCLLLEAMPGDRFSSSSDLAMRLMPMVSPMMHNVDVYMHFFFVPTRLIWKNFDKFLTGGDKGDEQVVAPYMKLSDTVNRFPVNVGDLGDYLGLPVGLTSIRCSALPFRAYALVYNEWYRAQSVIDPVALSTDDGADYTTSTVLLRRAWRRGYFEDALPWAQKGDPVNVPFAQNIPVLAGDDPTRIRVAGSGDTAVNMGIIRGASSGTGSQAANVRYTAEGATDNNTNLYAKVDSNNLLTINELRLAFQVQRYLELNARGGSRMIEFLLSHFGVRSSDARLQRPEYLGGGRCPIVIGDVLQTSETSDSGTPQGNMAGQGYAAMHTPSFRYRCEEFGYIIGLLSVMPQPTYQQGLHRLWSRFSRYDYPFPVFSHLGDQPIYEREIYMQTNSAISNDSPDGYNSSNNEVFGYAPRYEEFRKIPSQVHGQFRNTLEYWHLGRKFDSAPSLSADFINCTPSDRVFAVQDGSDKLVIQILHNTKVVRQLPKFGVPGLIDHL